MTRSGVKPTASDHKSNVSTIMPPCEVITIVVVVGCTSKLTAKQALESTLQITQKGNEQKIHNKTVPQLPSNNITKEWYSAFK